MDYALKLHRTGERPAWRTGLSMHDALATASAVVESEEGSPSPRYLTATIYRQAVVVSICRYFPPGMRGKAGQPAPSLLDDLE